MMGFITATWCLFFVTSIYHTNATRCGTPFTGDTLDVGRLEATFIYHIASTKNSHNTDSGCKPRRGRQDTVTA